MAPKFVRPVVVAMEGYIPGEQPRVGERVVKINTNENPFPPSPKVMQAIREMEAEHLRRYPDPDATAFRAAAAQALGVEPSMILTGNGSDDILAVAMQTFLSPGDILAFPDPTYSLYPVLAELDQVRVAPVPWASNWSLPAEALLATKARAIFLANPNAPSGTLVPPDELDHLASRFAGLLLIDEAYADFADDNCLALLRQHENIVITRTLSKAYSLAGLRFGFAVAQPTVIREMAKAKDSYPCDAVSILAATAAIEDQPYAQQSWQHVRAERQRVAAELHKLGWSVLPSQANFLLATCPDGDGQTAYHKLKAQGILVRYFDKPGLRDKLRITIGTCQENNALLGGIKALMGLAEQAA